MTADPNKPSNFTAYVLAAFTSVSAWGGYELQAVGKDVAGIHVSIDAMKETNRGSAADVRTLLDTHYRASDAQRDLRERDDRIKELESRVRELELKKR